MLLQLKQYKNAFIAYESVLKKSPNRFNSLFGAGRAAEKSGNTENAITYYRKLSITTDSTNSDRPELVVMRTFLSAH